MSKSRSHHKSKKKEKFEYHFLIVLMIIWNLHYKFLDQKTIGGNANYAIFIFWVPLSVGLVLYGYFKRAHILKVIKAKDGFSGKLAAFGFLLLKGLFFSYLSLGTLTNGIWNQMNKHEAEENTTDYITCEIESFLFNSNYKIWFYFHGDLESIPVDYQSIAEFKGYNPEDYQLILKVKEGLWEHYLVKDWEIIEIDKSSLN